MKRITIILLLLFLTTGTIFAQTLKIGFFQLEPYAIAGQNGANPTGAAVELWEKVIAPKMGVTLEWSGPFPLPRLQNQLKNGELDAVLIIAGNAERRATFQIPEKPFVYMQTSLTFLNTNPIQSIPSLETLNGMKIGYVEGAFLPPFMVNSKITIDKTTSSDYKDVNFQKLIRNRIDAILDMNDISNLYEAKQRGFDGKIKLLTLPVEPTPMYTGFAKTPAATVYFKSYVNIMSEIPDSILIDLLNQYK